MQPIPSILAAVESVSAELPASKRWRAVYREVALRDLDYRQAPPKGKAAVAATWTFETRTTDDGVNVVATQQTDLWPANPELHVEAHCHPGPLPRLATWSTEYRRTRRGPSFYPFAANEQGTCTADALEVRTGDRRLKHQTTGPVLALPCLLAALPWLDSAKLPREPFTFLEEFTLPHSDCRLRASKSAAGQQWLLTGTGLLPTTFVGEPGKAIRQVVFGRQRALLLHEIAEVQP